MREFSCQIAIVSYSGDSRFFLASYFGLVDYEDGGEITPLRWKLKGWESKYLLSINS